MNKTAMTLTAAALLACAAGASSAATMHTTQTFTKITNWTHTFSFPGFTPGPHQTLTSISETLTEPLSGTVKILNKESASALFSGDLTNTAVKTLPSPIGTVKLTNLGSTFSLTIPAGKTMTGLSSGTSSKVVTATSGLTAFEKAFTAPATDTGALTLHGPGNAVATFMDSGTITDKIVATFTTTTTGIIPEPATLSLLGAGLIGVAIARRRKRQA
jgi:PEP-CTERM motif